MEFISMVCSSTTAESILAAGVSIVQVKEKVLNDKDTHERARTS